MTKKHIHWLLSELETWVQEGIINDAQAQAIRGRYSAPEQAGTWGRIAFAAFGAILIGLGVILLFAYNWDKMHKFAKLAIVFCALISAHGAALIVKRTTTRQTLHVLGSMFFGAGIWLVAQTYHINEHYPNAFLVWGAGALALAWVLPSLPQALMATFLLVLWNGFESYGFQNANYAAPIVIFFGILPLAWIMRSRVLLSAGLAAFLFTLFSLFLQVSSHLGIPLFLSVAAALIAVGLIMEQNELAPELASTCFFFGNTLSVVLVYILTFRGAREALSFLSREKAPDIWFPVFLVIAAGLWIAALWPFRNMRDRLVHGIRRDYFAAPIALIIYALQFFGILQLRGFLATAPYNLLILFSAVMLMQRGFRDLNLRAAIMGSVLLSALAIARYTDLFQSLLARAAIFLLVGGMMLGVGIFFARSRKELKEVSR